MIYLKEIIYMKLNTVYSVYIPIQILEGGSFVSPKPQGQLKNSLYGKWPFSPSLPFIQHLYPISLNFGLCFTWGYIAKYRDCKIFANSKYLWTCNSQKMTLKLEMNLMCFWQYSPVWCCVSSLKVCSQLCTVYKTTLHQPENWKLSLQLRPMLWTAAFFLITVYETFAAPREMGWFTYEKKTFNIFLPVFWM